MWWLQRYPKLFDLATEYYRHGLHGLLDRLKSLPYAGGRAQALLFGQAFNWDYCREELQSVGIDPIFHRVRDNLEYWMNVQPSKKVDIDALSKACEELRKDDKFRKFFLWNSIDFFPVVEDYLQFLVVRLTPACLNAYERTHEILKKKKIKVFLSSGFTTCTSHSAARAARNLGIPVVVWRHTGHGPMDILFSKYIHLMSSDIVFVFEKGTVGKLSKVAKRCTTLLVPVGSPSLENMLTAPRSIMLEKLKKIVSLNKKIVLCVFPPYLPASSDLYLYTIPSKSDDFGWRSLRMLLDIFKKHPDCLSIVKLKPTKNRYLPVASYIKERGLENCQVIRKEYALKDLFQIAHLIVQTYPGVNLLESLMSTKPIFVYTGDFYLDTNDQKLLARRAFCYQKFKNLINDLDKYLSTGRIDKKVDLNNKEFIKRYGLSSTGSGTKVAKTLTKILVR